MTSSRALLFRILSIFGAGLAALLVAYSIFGWVVVTNQPWLIRLVGWGRFGRLLDSYSRVAGALLPMDRDGDGICDGEEMFWGTDPRNGLDHLILEVWLDQGGGTVFFDALGGNVNGIGLFPKHQAMRDRLIAKPGGRLHIRLHLEARRLASPKHFPRGFQLRITPPSYGRLALPGQPSQAGVLTVPVAVDGGVPFDMEIPPAALTSATLDEPLICCNAVTGEQLFTAQVLRVWPEEPITPNIEYAPPPPYRRHYSVCELRWPAIHGTSDAILVEMSRDETGEEWYPLYVDKTTETDSGPVSIYPDTFEPPGPPVKFRVVPIHYSPWPQ